MGDYLYVFIPMKKFFSVNAHAYIPMMLFMVKHFRNGILFSVNSYAFIPMMLFYG